MNGRLACRRCGARIGRHTERRDLVLDGGKVRVEYDRLGVLHLTCRGCGHAWPYRLDAGQAATWRVVEGRAA